MIAIVSDTHLPRGRRRLPDACARLLARADLIVHAGDFTAPSALEELEAFGPVAAVHGNGDEPALRELLPDRRTDDASGRRIGVVHDPGPAAGRHERLLAAFPGCGAIVYGHTHLPEIALAGRTWILNPGSPTERRRASAHTMIVWQDAEPPSLVELPG